CSRGAGDPGAGRQGCAKPPSRGTPEIAHHAPMVTACAPAPLDKKAAVLFEGSMLTQPAGCNPLSTNTYLLTRFLFNCVRSSLSARWMNCINLIYIALRTFLANGSSEQKAKRICQQHHGSLFDRAHKSMAHAHLSNWEPHPGANP